LNPLRFRFIGDKSCQIPPPRDEFLQRVSIRHRANEEEGHPMRRAFRLRFSLALACGSLIASGADATLYTFINIADNTTDAPTGLFDDFGIHPSISGSTVAFLGRYDSSNGAEGIFTGSGGALTTIAKTGDMAPSGTFDDGFGDPSISGSTVAFKGDFNAGSEGVSPAAAGCGRPLSKPATQLRPALSMNWTIRPLAAARWRSEENLMPDPTTVFSPAAAER
jgi:hypothetical protein